MIWESIVLMTIIDLIIIFLSFFLFWNYYQNRQLLRQLKAQYGIVAILCGFSVMALLYFADILTMHLLPRFMTMEKSMEIMAELHLHYNWILSTMGFILLVIGIVHFNKVLFPKIFSYQKNLKYKQEDLENEITERNRIEKELENLNEKLELRNKELKQITYITSHDLRSPLVSIQGFTSEIENSLSHLSAILDVDDVPLTIREEVASILGSDILESTKFVTSSIAKMDSLLSALLKLSRTEQAELIIKKLDINDVLGNVIQSLEFQIKEAKALVQVSSLPSCMGDEAQIDQVFSNLLSNALKYREPKRPCNIRVSGYIKYEMAIYCIEDNGIGISAEYHKEIFEFFRRVALIKQTGDGLGLAIVRKIVEEHQGKVWVESESDKGSKFFISLPIM